MDLSTELLFEACAVELTNREVRIVIIIIYRFNNLVSNLDTFFRNLEAALQMVSQAASVIIIPGDFDIDKKEDNPHSHRDSYLIESFNLTYTTDDLYKVRSSFCLGSFEPEENLRELSICVLNNDNDKFGPCVSSSFISISVNFSLLYSRINFAYRDDSPQRVPLLDTEGPQREKPSSA